MERCGIPQNNRTDDFIHVSFMAEHVYFRFYELDVNVTSEITEKQSYRNKVIWVSKSRALERSTTFPIFPAIIKQALYKTLNYCIRSGNYTVAGT